MSESLRGEKVPANAIPERRYEQFKYKLEELSDKYSERNLMIFYLGVATGYRLQDIVCLTIGELRESLDNGKFEIQEQKQYKSWQNYIKNNPGSNKKQPKKREVPIKANLRKLLNNYCRNKSKSAYAFESNKGKNHITQKAYSNILSKAGDSLNMKNISGHSLRKTYAYRLWEATRNLEYVRIALGHKSIETTKVYLGLNDEVREGASSIADNRL